MFHTQNVCKLVPSNNNAFTKMRFLLVQELLMKLLKELLMKLLKAALRLMQRCQSNFHSIAL